MSYLKAAEHADTAARQAAAAVNLRSEGEPDRAFESLAIAVEELATGMAELCRSLNRAD